MKPVLQNGVGGGGCSSSLDKQLESLVLLLFLSGARLFKRLAGSALIKEKLTGSLWAQESGGWGHKSHQSEMGTDDRAEQSQLY